MTGKDEEIDSPIPMIIIGIILGAVTFVLCASGAYTIDGMVYGHATQTLLAGAIFSLVAGASVGLAIWHENEEKKHR